MDYKQFSDFDLAVKAVGKDKGEFVALVSVFGNVDLVGDRVMPGAFTKSIDAWQGKGETVPVIFSHQHNDPMSYIGEVNPSDLTQNSKGLFVKGQLDLTNPFAAQTFKLMQRKAITGFSFGYSVSKEEATQDARELHEIDLFEVGPCFKGVNPEAAVVAVKSATDELLEANEPETDSEPATPRLAQLHQLMVESLLDS